jgi:hypothetical protein
MLHAYFKFIPYLVFFFFFRKERPYGPEVLRQPQVAPKNDK